MKSLKWGPIFLSSQWAKRKRHFTALKCVVASSILKKNIDLTERKVVRSILYWCSVLDQPAISYLDEVAQITKYESFCFVLVRTQATAVLVDTPAITTSIMLENLRVFLAYVVSRTWATHALWTLLCNASAIASPWPSSSWMTAIKVNLTWRTL